MSYPEFVEAKDVRFTTMQLVREGDGTSRLHVAGFIFHSALAVEDIELKRDGADVHMMVRLTPVRSGLSGRFDTFVALPDGVTGVTFGPAKARIWPAAAVR